MTRTSAVSMPALFVGHGNPMNAVSRNRWTEVWHALGAVIPRPKAILAVSAHWYISDTRVTVMRHPRTIHDFGGFPRELYEIRYPAPGDPALAAKVRGLLSPLSSEFDDEWGLDHGVWSVLCHLFPHADIPIVQLSIDQRQPPSFHYELGRLLTPLRDEGILPLGSGNIVHNLQAYDWERPDAEAPGWAARFDKQVEGLIDEGRDGSLINYTELGADGRLSIPTPDHYLPLLYVLGSRRDNDVVLYPVQGFDGGSMSMRAVMISER
jgi:4,5-DOPA dioxygenase extradiol